MEEIDEIRLRKLRELQQQQFEEEIEVKQKIEQLEEIARQVLTKEALARYGNIKAANPEKAVQVLAVIGQAVQSGAADKIDDEQLKEMLKQLTPEKKKYNLKFLR